MKKNGFVFIESVVVLVVVAISLTMLITSYSLISRKTKEKENFNRTSDKYLLYVISNLGVTDKCNYSNVASECGSKTNVPRALTVTPKDCKSNDKVSYLLPNCEFILNDYNVEHIYVIDSINGVLNNPDAVKDYTNGTLEYMKTLKKCNSSSETENLCDIPIPYMIGEFKRTDKYYYAAIEL